MKTRGKKKETLDEHFSKMYGARWTRLAPAMGPGGAERKVALWNRYSGCAGAEETPGLEECVEVPCQGLKLFQSTHPETPLPPPRLGTLGALPYYLLDYASVLAVEQLQVLPPHRVLDLCAAPGGKSVAIAQLLVSSAGGSLVANELNPERAARLQRVLESYLPRGASGAPPYEVLQRDGSRLHQPSQFDRILLDAPCSSERHVMRSPAELKNWSPSVTKEISRVQRSLLINAFDMLREGGRMVYSTCSISPVENDEVVRFALNRTKCNVKVVKPTVPLGEPTEFGCLILPDTSQGAGPLYISVLEKESGLRERKSDSDSDSG
jgi:hypothetical protein